MAARMTTVNYTSRTANPQPWVVTAVWTQCIIYRFPSYLDPFFSDNFSSSLALSCTFLATPPLSLSLSLSLSPIPIICSFSFFFTTCSFILHSPPGYAHYCSSKYYFSFKQNKVILSNNNMYAFVIYILNIHKLYVYMLYLWNGLFNS